jgi:opacity protein-like surface antigen
VLVSLLCILNVNSPVNAQTEDSKSQLISRDQPGGFWFFNGARPAKWENTRKYDRLIFDITYNDWVGDRTSFVNPGPSIGLNTNILFDIPLVQGNRISIGTGFYHSFFTVRHDQDFVVSQNGEFTTFQKKNEDQKFKKSVLGGNSIGLPLEIRFRTKGFRHMKLHLGGKVGYQLNMYNKKVYEDSPGDYWIKSFRFPGINRLTYGVHARLGVRNWALFASYAMNPILDSSSNAKLNLFQLGLSVSLY